MPIAEKVIVKLAGDRAVISSVAVLSATNPLDETVIPENPCDINKEGLHGGGPRKIGVVAREQLTPIKIVLRTTGISGS